MKISKYIPEDSFIGNFLKFKECTESPVEFDLWSAIWLLGALLDRHIYIDRPHTPIYFNWYIILVGESGRLRKSTALNHIKKVLEHFEYENLVNSKITPEALENYLSHLTLEHDKAEVAIVASELTTMLGRERYIKSFPLLLTDLFDCPKERKSNSTVSGNTLRRYKNVYLSLFGCSTSSWLLTAINPAVIEGGFTSRTIFVFGKKPKKAIPWPDYDNKLTSYYNKAIVNLQDILGVTKDLEHIAITDKALEAFKYWYYKREQYKDLYRMSFAGREDTHILKLAGILSINEGMYEIQYKHIKTATKMISKARDNAASLFDVEVLTSRLFIGIDRARIGIITAGVNGIKHRHLYMKCRNHMNVEEFRMLIDILHEMGMIEMFVQGNRRPSYIYRATKLLSDSKMMNNVYAVINEDI